MKKLSISFFAGILAFMMAMITPAAAETLPEADGTPAAAPSAITVTLNGAEVAFDAPPVNINGRVLVPFRAIGEAMGAEVEWDPQSKQVLLTLHNKYVQLTIGSTQMQYGEHLSSSFYLRQTSALDAPAQIIGDRTLVPVRAISEGLGATVTWDPKTNTVILAANPDVTTGASALPAQIQNRADLIAALTANIRNMEKDFTLSVKNYSQSEFDIKLFDYFNCIDSYSATEALGSGETKITYHIEYMTSYLVSAATSGDDTSALNERELMVYNAANNVIAEVIRPGMSDYEKEKAVHDYIIKNTVGVVTSTAAAPTDAFTAYGVLINHSAVSNGYSDTFLMFMDMLGIECATITGRVDGTAHTWNRVKLDEDYYLSDLALNDPSPDNMNKVLYDYFNVTNSVMDKSHRPDTNDGIVCDSTAYNYFYHNGLTVANQEEFEQAVANAVQNKVTDLALLCVGITPKDLDLSKVFDYHPGAFGHSVNDVCGVLHIEL